MKEYKDQRLDFLDTYEYDLGINDLLPYGADEYVRIFATGTARTSFLPGPSVQEKKRSRDTTV